MEASRCQWAEDHESEVKDCVRRGDRRLICCSTADGRGIVTEGTLRSISYQKCLEYSTAYHARLEVPALIVGEVSITKHECKIQLDGTQLVVGGERAKAEEFPHMALLGFGSEGNLYWGCGGSLISERFVLTAAHCLFDVHSQSTVRWARLGDINITSARDDHHAMTLEITGWHEHPDYTGELAYNDIALVQLAREVRFSTYVRPACIHHVEGSTSPQGTAFVSGWGNTETASGGSDVLMKAELKFINSSQCRARFNLTRYNNLKDGFKRKTQLCAASEDPDKPRDTCQGDSGGPIQVILKEPPCMYDVVGVTSSGPLLCADSTTPGIYTRVKNFLPWIESIVWPGESRRVHDESPI